MYTYTDPSAREKCTRAAVSALRSVNVPHSPASAAAADAVDAGNVRKTPPM